MNCGLLFLHSPCVRHTYKFTAWKSIPRLKSDWCIFHSFSWETFMHEFIAIKIVSCFPSFEANFCLRNNQDGYRSKSVTAMGDLIIWKLSLLYSLSRVVHRLVQRKQFTFVFRVQNLCEKAVSWQRQSAASGDVILIF